MTVKYLVRIGKSIYNGFLEKVVITLKHSKLLVEIQSFCMVSDTRVLSSKVASVFVVDSAVDCMVFSTSTSDSLCLRYYTGFLS